MKINVLGSGNAFNTNGRAHAAYLIEAQNSGCILLDCGATTLYRLQQINFDFDLLDGVLLTHFHGDHIGGLPFLFIQLWLVEKRNRTLKVIGPVGVKEICKSLMDICYPGFFDKCLLEFIEVSPDESIDFITFGHEIQIKPFKISHRPESLGYRAREDTKEFAFSGDSSFDQNLFDLVDGVDLALIELSILSQDEISVAHVSLEEVKLNIEKLNAHSIVFTHIYDELARAAEKMGYKTAYDGMVLEV